MKEVTFKAGTKAEIVKYMAGKIKGTVGVSQRFGEPAKWPKNLNEGDIVQHGGNTVEKQIDDFIMSGSPLVSISLLRYGGETFREQFILTDYAEQKIMFEMKRIDDDHIRHDRLESALVVVGMDIEAAERNESQAAITTK